jgi:nucleoid DNA-binding protein
MRKSDIARAIADKASLTQVKAEDAVDAILAEIKATLSQGEAVILRRFGTFSVRAKKARKGRNPKTGESADIAARRVVRFQPGKPFKNAVNRDL